jgi:hypothetical protein
MIYRRPSFGKPQFVLSVVAASTGAIFVGGACDDTMIQANEPEQVDAAENVPSSTSGTSAGGGFVGSIGGSNSGTSASSGGCFSNSSSGCNLILYDATNDAIENLDTGADQEAAAGDSSGDGETSDAAPEASEQ